MQFRLWTIFYVMALLGAALAAFGTWGILAALTVLIVWLAKITRKGFSLAETLVVVVIVMVLIALLLPAVQAASSSARRAHCYGNLKQLALALNIYHDEYGSFPPAYVADEDGAPMHSWRVLILPYLGEREIYDKYRFDEPCDGPNNSKLMQLEAPMIYQCPRCPEPSEMTQYFAVLGPQTAWPNDQTTSLEDMKTDGASNTILLIEAHGKGVHWMDPTDVSYAEAIELLTKPDKTVVHPVTSSGRFFYRKDFEVTSLRILALADGGVWAADNAWTRESAIAMLTIDGGEGLDRHNVKFANEASWRLDWNRIVSLTLFIILAFLPAPWVLRQEKKANTEQTEQPLQQP